MRPKLTIVVSLAVFVLAGCASDGLPPQISQSRAIDTDIDATHVVGPVPMNSASPSTAPWRGEEDTDQLRSWRQQLQH